MSGFGCRVSGVGMEDAVEVETRCTANIDGYWHLKCKFNNLKFTSRRGLSLPAHSVSLRAGFALLFARHDGYQRIGIDLPVYDLLWVVVLWIAKHKLAFGVRYLVEDNRLAVVLPFHAGGVLQRFSIFGERDHFIM